MELNAIANLKLLIYMAEQDKKINDSDLILELNNQLDLLRKYLEAFSKNPKITWHEVRDAI